jgi:hypothetical protein
MLLAPRRTNMIQALLVCLFLVAPAAGLAADANGRNDARLEQDEIVAARSASRAFFAAQRAERRESEALGAAGLKPHLDDLRARVRQLRLAQSRLDAEPALVSAAAGAHTAASLPADAGARRAERAQERRARIAEIRLESDGLRQRAREARDNASRLRSPRQRALAVGAAARLERLNDSVASALDSAATGDPSALEQLAVLLSDAPSALNKSAAEIPDPTFVTRIRHRREIPRVP